MNSANLGGGRDVEEGGPLTEDEVESKGQANKAVMMLSHSSLISVEVAMRVSIWFPEQMKGRDKSTNLCGHKIDHRLPPAAVC